ncbi:MAG TPA: DJ-1/PfpI family protein [Pyrinomonadaceae bacterium]|nr:DJ-1/PfpI family protein [Pyrinomonadaceae bacterium]
MKRMQLLIVAFALSSIINLGLAIPTKGNHAGQGAQKQQSAPRNLAILIFDGVQIIDYTGPFETFGHVYRESGEAFNIYTVSEKSGAITTSMGMSVNPKYNFENAPEPDVLVVPGGSVKEQTENPVVIKWIQEKSKRAEIVMSVCNGAYILAKAGLLDGLEATTTSGLIAGLRQAAPKTKVVDDKRLVDNGKIITTAGLSSGIDGSLHVIERLFGRGTAQMAALGMEYNWDPDSKYVRAALADKYLRFNYEVKVLEGGWQPLSRAGSRDEWENKWVVKTEASAAEILESVNKTIATNKIYGNEADAAKWARTDDVSRNSTQSWWRFTDEKGGTWNGVVSVEPKGERNEFILSVKVSRNASAKSKNN